MKTENLCENPAAPPADSVVLRILWGIIPSEAPWGFGKKFTGKVIQMIKIENTEDIFGTGGRFAGIWAWTAPAPCGAGARHPGAGIPGLGNGDGKSYLRMFALAIRMKSSSGCSACGISSAQNPSIIM